MSAPQRRYRGRGRTGAGSARRAAGMVLIAVLWIVAALAILVTGMAQTLRGQARSAGAERQLVQAAALGDAAIHIAVQAVLAGRAPPTRLTVVQAQYRGQSMAVEILPLNGLIDINGAPPALLARLFVVAAGLAPRQAELLAQAAVDWRAQRADGGNGAARGFEACEDLLQVPGVDYGLYATIAPLITADLAGGGRVNPMAAPQPVLTVLADGNAALAGRIAARRDAGDSAIDTTGLAGEFTDNAATQRFRFQALVALPDGGQAAISRSLEFLPGARGEGLPWRSFRTQQRLVPQAEANPT